MAVKTGIGCFIDPSVEIQTGAVVELGDHVYIGKGVKILSGKLRIGDYSKIHDNVYINPKGGIDFGHLTWIGQDSIIDGTGGIRGGNYIGIGMRSALYSHIRHGDVLEGSNYNGNKRLILGDDVWFVGQCLVSPIIAGNKSMAMLGSVVIKEMEINRVYGGNPALDITDKMKIPYDGKSTDEKYAEMIHYVKEYQGMGNKIILLVVEKFPDNPIFNVPYYNINTRTYLKTNNEDEVRFNKWLFKYKAKFIPE